MAEDTPASLATFAATPLQRRVAVAVVVVSAVFFLAAVPFAKQPIGEMWAFIPSYQSALIFGDLVTAYLLFAQFRVLRSRALLVLASGYLFTAFMAIAHALSFPGLFAAGGLLGAGPQSTAWLYMFWHGGFPLFVIAFAWLKGRGEADNERGGAIAVIATIAAVVLAACALTALTTIGQGLLPPIMQGNRYTPAMIGVVASVWALSAAALVVLWRRGLGSVLELWLAVVMCAWIFDIGLAAVLNAGRFDLGFYAGRIYGLLAASLVLLAFLIESARLHASVVKSLARHAERLRILHEIDRAVVAEETPEAIAGAVIQPLRALLGVPRAIVNRFDLAAGEVEWIAAAGRRRTHVGPGVRYAIALMGDVQALRRGEPQTIDVKALPHSPEAEALLASGVQVYRVVPMIAGGELLGAISFGAAADGFPQELLNIAEEVATQLAIALAQARLLGAVKSHAADLEARVRERTEALQAANKELESFSYSVSHDLRSPLRAVDGYAQMLQEDYGSRLDEEGRRLLAVVRDSSLRMGRLIDDLLAFSRLGRQEPAKRPIDMTSLAREVIDELPGSRAAAIELPALPPAHADRALLKQVWANLVSNALKYSGKRPGPRIEIGGEQNGTENVYWVRDNGVGFDMKYAGKLFGVFQRLHRQDEFDGTGVGLAIVQRVVARHGGRVWAEGKPGDGACFHFSLPLAA
jgi:signal transduction histidine kinase